MWIGGLKSGILVRNVREPTPSGQQVSLTRTGIPLSVLISEISGCGSAALGPYSPSVVQRLPLSRW
jgi:hypothetical protein